MTRHLRRLKPYLKRRKIQDMSQWLSNSGIKTYAQLQRFCESNALHLDISVQEFNASLMSLPEKRVQSPKTMSKQESRGPEDTAEKESWHVPAAERPIRLKSSAKKSSAASKKPKSSRATTKRAKK